MNRLTLAWIVFTALLLSLIGVGTLLSSDASAATGIAGSLKGSISDLPASPFNDPHIPSYNNGWCPGGGLGVEGRAGWCDGEDYDDGTFWHQRGYEGVWGFKISTACSIRTDNPLMLEHAPAGGCGGDA